MKKLFLHIGFNKTGSTSIQKNLAQNAAVLQGQGIYYPSRPEAPYIQARQHVPLARAIPGRDVRWLKPHKRATLDSAYDVLLRDIEAADCPTVVLSSESFTGPDINRDMTTWLCDRLSGFDVTVLAYIRRQDSYFISTYQEQIKSGGARAFEFDGFENRKPLYFAERLAPWRAAFGPGRVQVRPFDPRQWPEGELFFDVLDIIGARREGIAVSEPANEGLDYRAVELLRQLNALNTRLHEGDRTKPRWRRWHEQHRKLAGQLSRMFAEGEGGRQKLSLSAAQVEALRAHFRADNIAALEGSGVDVDTFFAPARPDQAERMAPGLLPQLLSRLARSGGDPSRG